jgi:hypothetical protein
VLNTDPYEASNVDEFSAEEDVDLALSNLRENWAIDNEYIAGQSLKPDVVAAKLNEAESTEEYNLIKLEADKAFSSAQTAQAQVDSKYQTELTRLTALKQQIQTNTSGQGNVQSGNDARSTVASPESSAIPPLTEE